MRAPGSEEEEEEEEEEEVEAYEDFSPWSLPMSPLPAQYLWLLPPRLDCLHRLPAMTRPQGPQLERKHRGLQEAWCSAGRHRPHHLGLLTGHPGL